MRAKENFFQPKTPKSNSFSEHFFTKSHNLAVNFFNLSIDTPTYQSNQTNLPRPLKQNIFSFKHTSQGHGSIDTVQTDQKPTYQDSAWSHFSYPLLLLSTCYLYVGLKIKEILNGKS